MFWVTRVFYHCCGDPRLYLSSFWPLGRQGSANQIPASCPSVRPDHYQVLPEILVVPPAQGRALASQQTLFSDA